MRTQVQTVTGTNTYANMYINALTGYYDKNSTISKGEAYHRTLREIRTGAVIKDSFANIAVALSSIVAHPIEATY